MLARQHGSTTYQLGVSPLGPLEKHSFHHLAPLHQPFPVHQALPRLLLLPVALHRQAGVGADGDGDADDAGGLAGVVVEP